MPKRDKHIDYESIRFYGYKPRKSMKHPAYLPSVTSCTRLLDKGYGYEVWLGNMKSHKAACDYRDKRARMGLEAHARAALIAKSKFKKWPKFRTNRGFMESLRKFVDVFKPNPLFIEETMINLDDWYAGTGDLICTIEVNGQRVLALLDYKSKSAKTAQGKKASPSIKTSHYRLQTGGYARTFIRWLREKRPALWRKYGKDMVSSAVMLRDDGAFSMQTGVDFRGVKQVEKDGKAFMKLREVMEWEQEDRKVDLARMAAVALPITKAKIVVGKI